MDYIATRYRSHTCGQLRASDANTTVKLAGWVHSYRDHGGLVFIDLRDRDGLTQLVFDADLCGKTAHDLARALRCEWVVSITGQVTPRFPSRFAHLVNFVILSKNQTKPTLNDAATRLFLLRALCVLGGQTYFPCNSKLTPFAAKP